MTYSPCHPSLTCNGVKGKQTAYAFMEQFMWHDTNSQSAGYFLSGIYSSNGDSDEEEQPAVKKYIMLEPDRNFENADTKRRLHNLLEVTNMLHTHLDRIPPHLIEPVSIEFLTKFHTLDYINKIKHMSENKGGDAGESVPFGPGSFEIARLAVGACIACVDAIMDPHNSIKNGYALVRPPGHHAERDQGRGYCMLNNVVLTAIHLKEKYGLKRVAIFDFDVHHGNGVQQAFYSDPSVLYISIHEEDNFPKKSGHMEEIGEGDGLGYNINIPLPPGSGTGAYQYVMDHCVTKALRLYQPEFILVSAGYDAAVLDPLGRMQLVSSSYRYITEQLLHVANEVCQDRLCYFHEGGYSSVLVPLCGIKSIEALCGISEEESMIHDPFNEEETPKTTQTLKEHEKVVIDEAIKLLGSHLQPGLE